MPEVEANDLPATMTAGYRSRPATVAAGVLQCLVVSGHARRRGMLAEAAADGGWQTLVCGDAASAMQCVNRAYVQLAVVDLGGVAWTDYRPLLERLAPVAELLLVVCGNEGNVPEEIAVRQLGAWMYLPGVDDIAGVAVLCSEARHLAEKLSQLQEAPRSSHRPTRSPASDSKG